MAKEKPTDPVIYRAAELLEKQAAKIKKDRAAGRDLDYEIARGQLALMKRNVKGHYGLHCECFEPVKGEDTRCVCATTKAKATRWKNQLRTGYMRSAGSWKGQPWLQVRGKGRRY